MTYTLAVIITIFCASTAGLASFMVDRKVGIETRRRHHEVGNQVFQLIGVMFSVLLAFVFSEVWSQYNTAAQSISAECGALHGASIIANALPNKMGRPVNRAILGYVEDVVRIEWPTMAARHRSTEAADQIRAAIDVAARLDISTGTDQSQILSLLAAAHANRETRTFQLGLGLPDAMWVVLISLALILTGFVILSGTEPPGSIVFAALFAGSIVLVLLLVRMLDYPFEGALALSNADFVKLGEQVSGMIAGH